MKAFTIDADNNITIHASRKDAAAFLCTQTNGLIFTNDEQLAEALKDRSGAALIEIFNSFTGVTPVKKFMDRKAAVRRIWRECEKMTVAEAPVERIETPEAVFLHEVVEPKPAKAKKTPKSQTQASAPRATSKTAQLIEDLKTEAGMTLGAICQKYGWQKHTTRALMSAGGAIAKKHGITVISEKVGDDRRYRIAN
jgi:hypothetical protein